MSDLPKRAYEVRITIGADSKEDALTIFRSIAHEAWDGNFGPSVSGGYSGGSIVEVEEHPEMTHDRYFEALQPHLDRMKAGA